MTDPKPLLLPHFEIISNRTDELGGVFYKLLDQRHPELMSSFGSESKQRDQMLTQILAAVHDSMYVDDSKWVALQLEALGRAHVDWKVTTEMYTAVCACLVEALSTMSNSNWSDELERVWTAQLAWISKHMHGQHG